MLQNAYFLAKIGADTAENEQHFAEILDELNVRRSYRQATDLRTRMNNIEYYCSFSAVSTPIFASKYSLELAIRSKRRLRKKGTI